MIAWFKKLFGPKTVAVDGMEYSNLVARQRALKEEVQRQKAAAREPTAAQIENSIFQKRRLQVESDTRMREAGYVREVRRNAEGKAVRVWVKPRPVAVSPHLAAAYGRTPPPATRTSEPPLNTSLDLLLVQSLLASPPAPPAPEPDVYRETAAAITSGGGGDFGGGGASSSWDSGSSSSDSSSSSSDSGSSSSSSD